MAKRHGGIDGVLGALALCALALCALTAAGCAGGDGDGGAAEVIIVACDVDDGVGDAAPDVAGDDAVPDADAVDALDGEPGIDGDGGGVGDGVDSADTGGDAADADTADADSADADDGSAGPCPVGGSATLCGGVGTCAYGPACVCPAGTSLGVDGQCTACTCDVAGVAVPLPVAVSAVHPLQPEVGGYVVYGTIFDLRAGRLATASPHDATATGFGKVAIHERSAAGVWAHQATLTAPAAAEASFGRNVALSMDGNRLAVLSLPSLSANVGAHSLRVFDRGATGQWSAGPAISAPAAPAGTTGALLGAGEALAVAGPWLVAGSSGRHQNVDDPYQGQLVFFHEATPGNWTQAQVAWGAVSGRRLGHAVDLQGLELIVGAPGATVGFGSIWDKQGEVQVWTANGQTWTLGQTIVNATATVPYLDGFGGHVQRKGDRLYVAAPRHGGCSVYHGAVHVLQRQPGGPFQPLVKVVGASAGCQEEMQFGHTIALLGAQLVGHSASGATQLLRGFDPAAAGAPMRWRLPLPKVPAIGAPLAAWAPGDGGWVQRIAADGTTLAVGVLRGNGATQPGIFLYELGAGACDAAGLCDCLPGYGGPDCATQTCQNASECDDGNPCTGEACQNDGAGTYSCSNPPLGGPCSDGNACTEGDACQAGACLPGGAKVCADGNPCTQDACLATVGCVFALSLTGACDDGKACTKDDVCKGKTGCAGTAVVCDDGDACTIDACVEPGGCATTAAPNGTACSDGDACTTGEACQGGACLPGSATAVGCDDGNPCTIDGCLPATGCVATWDATATCGGTGTCALAGGCTCPPGQSLNAQGQCQACSCPIAGAAGLVHAPLQALESPSLVADPSFGYQVRLRGQRLFVASPRAHALPETTPALAAAERHGAIFVYERNAAGQFAVAQRLALSGAEAVAKAELGATMAVDPTGKRVVARARYGQLANGQYAIGAKLWVFDEVAPGSWTASGPLAPPAPISSGPGYGHDGMWLDVEGDTIALGDAYRSHPTMVSAGRVVIYRRQSSGAWTVAQEIWGTTAGQQFGFGVDLDGAHLVASAVKETGGTALTRVFAWNGNSFVQTHAIPHPQPTHPNVAVRWSFSAALSGTTLVVNRQFFGGCASAAAHGGALYHYALAANGVAQLVGKAFDTPADCHSDAHFGTQFALDGGLLYVANEDYLSHRHSLRSYHLGAAGYVRDQFAWLPVLTAPAGPPPSWSYTTGTGPGAAHLLWAHDLDARAGTVAVGLQNGHQSRGFVVVYEPSAGACDAAGQCLCAPGSSGPDCQTQLCTTQADCDDDNPCTKDSCGGAAGATVCVHQPLPEGPCTDNNACTSPDVCKAGVCVPGAAPSCDDGKPCTQDSCLPSIGCVHVAVLEGPCDDGNPCTVDDACQPKVGCQGAPYDCDDGNACTVDSCLPPQAAGKPVTCKHVAVTDGVPCDDGDVCTEADTCKLGVCVAGALAVCSDGDACTLDGCHPQSGCLYTPSAAPECQLPCDPLGSVPMHRAVTEFVDPDVMRTRTSPVAPTPLALRGDTLIAGWSPFPGGAQSRLAIYRRVSGAWTLQQTLQSGSTSGGFWGHFGVGRDVAVSPDGGLIVALEPSASRAVTWSRNSAGVYGAMISTSVSVPQGNPQWAAAMHTDGVTLLITAPALTGPVYVWRWNGGSWQGTGSPNVLPSGAAPATSLGLDGPSAALTGAPGANAGAGTVHLYTRNVAGVWGLVGQLSDATAVAGQGFGRQLARSGDVLAVTATYGGCQPVDATLPRPGHVSVFHRVPGGWQHSHTLQAPGAVCAPAAFFGTALAFDGADLFVGAPLLPAPGVAGALGAVLRYRASAAGTFQLIDALRPSAPLLPLSALAPYGTTDLRRYGLATSASAGRVAVFSAMEETGPAKPTRTTLWEPVAGAANAFGQCVCQPGWSGKGCAVQSCVKATECDDGNPCTTDSCEVVGGKQGACVHGVGVAKATPCSDGDLCTEVDACQGGKCVGFSPKSCDDGKFCTTDSCDVETGACVSKLVVGCKG